MPRLVRAAVVVLGITSVVPAAGVAGDDVAAADVAVPKVTVLSPGTAPRATLRLALGEGDVARRDLTVGQKIDQSVDGRRTASIDAPPIRMTLEQTVDMVAPDGGAELSYAYTGVAVTDDGSIDEATRRQLETTLAPLTEVTGTQTVTARNEVVESDVEGLDGFDPTLSRSLSQLSDQAASLSVPFPKEKVGVGARWRGTSTTVSSGIETQQRYEYTLRERDGDTAVIGVTYVQTAKPQRADVPGVPAGAVVRVKRFRITGGGESTVDLGQSLPTASEIRASGRQLLNVRAERDQGELAQDIELSVTIETPILDRTSG